MKNIKHRTIQKKRKIVVKLLKKETYLAMIKNSCGSLLWRNNYALVNGKKKDIVRNGATSYAFFVSSILKTFNLIKGVHVTVKGTEKDLKKSQWKEILVNAKISPGSILI